MKEDEAKCNSCGHIQLAVKGWECEKCGEQTFTEKEEADLIRALNSKFVPLK